MKDDKTGDGLPPLPEPLDYCYEWDGPYGSRKFSAALHNGRPPDRSVAIYTADQIRARDAMWAERLAAAVARERAKWEAAQTQTKGLGYGVNPRSDDAAAIRKGD